MKRHLLLGVILAGVILSYGVIMQILPIRSQLLVLQTQNQSLKLQISKAQAMAVDNQGLDSDVFYHWFSSQPWATLHLLTLTKQQNNLQLQWEGSMTESAKLFDMLQASRVNTLMLSKNVASVNVNIIFGSLLVQESQVVVVPRVQPMQMPIKSNILGKIKKNGQIFCVLETNGKVSLQKGASC